MEQTNFEIFVELFTEEYPGIIIPDRHKDCINKLTEDVFKKFCVMVQKFIMFGSNSTGMGFINDHLGKEIYLALEALQDCNCIMCPECFTCVDIDTCKIEGYDKLVECPECGHPTLI